MQKRPILFPHLVAYFLQVVAKQWQHSEPTWIPICKRGALVATIFLLLGCNNQRPRSTPIVKEPAILSFVPHDITAFTQGLVIDGDVWLESTGRYGHSELREVERQSGKVLRSVTLPENLFGEGLALFAGNLYQLTWREGLCFVYDRETFEVVGHFRYEGEGWGLTNCDQWLYMSNGSDTMQVRDPASFRIIRTIDVHDHQGPVTQLNELAWIEGEIWANIFETKTIARINPETGHVIGYLTFDHLPLPGHEHPKQDVFNGIAYDPKDQSIWVTGKKWSHLYQIQWPL